MSASLRKESSTKNYTISQTQALLGSAYHHTHRCFKQPNLASRIVHTINKKVKMTTPSCLYFSFLFIYTIIQETVMSVCLFVCPAIESKAFAPIGAKILTRMAGPKGLPVEKKKNLKNKIRYHGNHKTSNFSLFCLFLRVFGVPRINECIYKVV